MAERPKNKAVGIWIRVSTEDQVQGDSPEHHERRARAYADSNDWIIHKVYKLDGVSGKAVSDHPETKRMLADIEEGIITGLIFSKLARLARNTRELLEFADRFRKVGADLISIQEKIDTSSPAGRLFFTMIAALAEWERAEITDRIRASVRVRAEMGKTLGGPAPFGFQWVDKRLAIDPEEAPIRRKMYELYAEHHRLKTVARLLNQAGLRTRRGADFTHTTVERLLKDTTGKGEYKANHTTKDDKGKIIPKPREEWIFTPCDPIVPEELWNRCNQLLDGRKKKEPIGPKPVHLFAGLLRCGCGQKMYVFSRTSKYICQKCKNKIPLEDLEFLFREELKAYFFSKDVIKSHLDAAHNHLRQHTDELDLLTRKKEKIRSEMEKAYKLYREDRITSERFGEINRPLEEQDRQLALEIPRLEGQIDALRIKELSSEEVIQEAESLHAAWPKLGVLDKRKVVDSITEQIVVAGDRVSITLCALPSSEEFTKRQRNVCPTSRGVT